MADMRCAETILSQLGGQRFVAMTGAKNFVGSDNSLSFRLPGAGGYCKASIDFVRIHLEPSDTYTVEFGKIRGTTYKVVESVGDVYNDSLTAVVERVTGLRCSL
jgi:hypothetical protein